ncbi:MAG: hypothetical protein R2855_16385 [Thermomicrobiales bacterium]
MTDKIEAMGNQVRLGAGVTRCIVTKLNVTGVTVETENGEERLEATVFRPFR